MDKVKWRLERRKLELEQTHCSWCQLLVNKYNMTIKRLSLVHFHNHAKAARLISFMEEINKRAAEDYLLSSKRNSAQLAFTHSVTRDAFVSCDHVVRERNKN